MPVIIYDSPARVTAIHSSRNLRGILDHVTRQGPPESVTLRGGYPEPAPYRLRVIWPNRHMAESTFADWRVAADWLVARRTWWPMAVTGPVPFMDRVRARRPH